MSRDREDHYAGFTRNELARELDDANNRIRDARAAARRFFHADGTFEEMEPHEVVQRRIACAVELESLRARCVQLEEALHDCGGENEDGEWCAEGCCFGTREDETGAFVDEHVSWCLKARAALGVAAPGGGVEPGRESGA